MLLDGRRVKRGKAALTSLLGGYQQRLIYWGMDALMQLSVSTQAAHLWICFSTVLTSAGWCSPQTKQRHDGEAATSLCGVPLVAVDVFFLCQVQCARGLEERLGTRALLFGSGEQLK